MRCETRAPHVRQHWSGSPTLPVSSFPGFCDITLLRGQASIYGYALMVVVTKECICAAMESCAPLEVTIKKALSSKKGDVGKKQTISKALKKANKTDILELISSERLKELEQLLGCVVLVESIRKEEQEWMVAAEDTGCSSRTVVTAPNPVVAQLWW